MQVLKAEKFETIVDGAARVFAQVSYRRAMMSDIAAEAGVALATVYRYAETKEALFELALRRGFGMPLDVLWAASRQQMRFRSVVETFVREQFEAIGRFTLLSGAVAHSAPPDVSGELEAVVGEVYDAIDRYHLGIRILDRSTSDWPELAKVFVAHVRGPVLGLLEQYLTRRARERRLPTPPDPAVAARLILETCATLAMHRHYTAGGTYASPSVARATAVHAVVYGFGPLKRVPPPRRRSPSRR